MKMLMELEEQDQVHPVLEQVGDLEQGILEQLVGLELSRMVELEHLDRLESLPRS